MRQDEIEKIRNKVLDETADVSMSELEFINKFIQATEQYLLTHLPEGIEETDNEIAKIIRKVIGNIPSEYAPAYAAVGIDEMNKAVKEILSKLSPHLLKLKEENERLKGEVEICGRELQGADLQIKTCLETIKQKQEAVSQAVQQERERIIKEIKSRLFIPARNTYQSAHNNLIDNLLDDLEDKSLEQER